MKRLLFVLILVVLAAAPVWSQSRSTGKKKPATGVRAPHKKPAAGKTNKAASTPAKNGTNKAAPGRAEAEKKPTEEVSKAGTIEATRLDTFKLQVSPLVRFFESSLNFLADPRNAVSDKQTILSQSYLKWCWNEKVQIEDDLEENRLVPLYKDMPAYLSDVSFFFKSARFSYSVQDVSVSAGEDGHTFFKVTANRNLRGITLNGDSVSSNKVRYLEMNFDSAKQQLKIVSVYTTKLNEKEDLRNWWNALTPAWKAVLSDGMKLEGTMPMASIDSFNDSVAMVGGQKTFIMGSEFYQYLGQIVRATRLDLSGKAFVVNLEPLGKLADLTEVDLSGTPVSDLMPLRNLNKLEILDLSGTRVSDLEPLRYCNRISDLRMKGTRITSLSVLSSFPNLTALDISGTQVASLEPLRDRTRLKELRIDRTPVKDLGPIENLVNLELLNFSSTGVTDPAPLKSMQALRILLCDSTAIGTLAPLEGMAGLQKIYCNHSGIHQKEALAFLKKRPAVSLVYASDDLSAWWKNMSAEWRNIFSLYMDFNGQPNSEQLHLLALLDSINITGRMSVVSLEPLSRLILLRTLHCQSTGISSLDPLKDLTELKMLNASNTKITSLRPLSGLSSLETLHIDNTQVSDLAPLQDLKDLKLVLADNTLITVAEADRFAGKSPGCLVVFQTYENTEWWQGLPDAWKEVLAEQAGVKGTPDKLQLQRMAGLSAVAINENFRISDLSPLYHLSRLTDLRFSGTSIARLDPVTRLTKLRVLHCPKNPIVDLMPVAGLPALTELDFSNTQVEDLDALQNMMKLEVLKFNGTQVKNLKYLQKLVNLKVIEFYNTRVGNVDVLDGMPELTSVKMFNTKVSSKRVEKLKLTHPGCEIIYY
ncbi:MAG TPA: leucine-rich repeat domain-containing protein [Bacteroidales bacterium]|nr:leucine-rich repeat domain-containing protein [Bacteroidales bacterium]